MNLINTNIRMAPAFGTYFLCVFTCIAIFAFHQEPIDPHFVIGYCFYFVLVQVLFIRAIKWSILLSRQHGD